MSVLSKLMGVAAGASAVAVIGIAVAQGVPPDPRVPNPAMGAGQQSTQGTSMGETGILAEEPMPPVAARAEPAIVAAEPPPPVAQAPEPAPPPPVAEAPPPAPAPQVAQAPAPMPEQQVAQAPAPRADRN